jgi:hypothetical protein
MTKRTKNQPKQQQPEKDTRYNGWTNYETWAVALWMDNEQGTQEYFHDMAREAIANNADKAPNPFSNDPNTNVRYELVQRLKAHYDEEAEQFMANQASVFADLINSALGSVNWYEIANHLLDSVNEE